MFINLSTIACALAVIQRRKLCLNSFWPPPNSCATTTTMVITDYILLIITGDQWKFY